MLLLETLFGKHQQEYYGINPWHQQLVLRKIATWNRYISTSIPVYYLTSSGPCSSLKLMKQLKNGPTMQCNAAKVISLSRKSFLTMAFLTHWSLITDHSTALQYSPMNGNINEQKISKQQSVTDLFLVSATFQNLLYLTSEPSQLRNCKYKEMGRFGMKVPS